MYKAYQYESDEKTRFLQTAVTATEKEVSPPGKWKVRHFKNVTAAPNTTIISLTFGTSPAIAGVGIVLYPGDSVTESISEGYIPYRGTIRAVGSDANGLLAIFER